MDAKEFILRSLTVTVGLLIFVIVVYIVLRIFTSEGFEALRLNNENDIDIDEMSDVESLSDEDNELEMDENENEESEIEDIE